MNNDLLNASWLAASFLALFGLAELLYHKLKIQAEYTRKLVHLGTGILTLLFPLFLSSHWWVLVLCSSFAAILLLSLRFNMLKSINAVDRITWGSLCYPVSVYVCFLCMEKYAAPMYVFYLPILTLAICDPLAALFGKRWPIGKYSAFGNSKSLMGSSVFFVSSLVLCFMLIPQPVILSCLIIAFIATISEAVSNNGFDNLSIPFSVLAVCIYLLN